ncbi:hypothetical protein ACIG0C_33345 [Kitasatospora aureofaciens]|uniref:Uncharacterized protein n=1 Tax=Kitasatospora aureofaciens TaxID=1894 RepID=A0A8H9LUJ7_KITAU|nr:hypothetical protein [Kitasatospora aureofaciens]GGV04498.1 hypothetical protein GCM10010502_69040 [Kitasatospora aureofaciens]
MATGPLIKAKGGASEWIHWQSGAAQLLPRLIAGRTEELFLTEHRAPAGTLSLDVRPTTGRARLSYRRAAEIFEEATRLLANPLARPEQWADLQGFSQSALTHDAEDGTSTPMLLARSRHASVRSLARYARPGVAAVARHVAAQDPAARRRSWPLPRQDHFMAAFGLTLAGPQGLLDFGAALSRLVIGVGAVCVPVRAWASSRLPVCGG